MLAHSWPMLAHLWLSGGHLGSFLDPSWPSWLRLGALLGPVGRQLGAKGVPNGSKIIKNEVLDQPLFDKCSQMVPRAPPGLILEGFWDDFGTIFM